MLLRTRPETVRRRSAGGALATLVGRADPAHLALGRTGAGAVMVLRPRALPQALGIDSATATRMGWAVQMLGAREIALGLGTLAALRSGDRAGGRLWVAAGVVADAVDALAVAGALTRGRVRPGTGVGVLAVAAGATALGLRALQQEQVPPL